MLIRLYSSWPAPWQLLLLPCPRDRHVILRQKTWPKRALAETRSKYRRLKRLPKITTERLAKVSCFDNQSASRDRMFVQLSQTWCPMVPASDPKRCAANGSPSGKSQLQGTATCTLEFGVSLTCPIVSCSPQSLAPSRSSTGTTAGPYAEDTVGWSPPPAYTHNRSMLVSVSVSVGPDIISLGRNKATEGRLLFCVHGLPMQSQARPLFELHVRLAAEAARLTTIVHTSDSFGKTRHIRAQPRPYISHISPGVSTKCY